MLRSYCRVALAAFGWLILSAANHAPQQGNNSSNSAASNETVAPYAPYANLNSDACYRAQNHDTADLCAQWRAAIAAEKSAHEADRATNWAIVSAVLSAFALGALLWTLRQTERALEEARQANRIAEKTAKRELRAYLSVEPQGVLMPTPGKKEHQTAASIVNHGQTPAYEVHVAAAIAVADPAEFVIEPVDVREQDLAEMTLGPGQTMHFYGGLMPLKPTQETKIGRHELAIVCYGTVHYRDCFDRKQSTDFCYYYSGPELSADNAIRMKRGNKST